VRLRAPGLTRAGLFGLLGLAFSYALVCGLRAIGGDDEGGAQVDGKTLFTEGNGESTACGACHTLSDAGTSATTGPNLDEVLGDMTPEQIREAIVDPNNQIARGFGEGIMPDNYEQLLSKEELDALVTYLDEVSR